MPSSFLKTSDIPYYGASDPAAGDRCTLDYFLPEPRGTAPGKVLLWFHGGGLTAGDKADEGERLAHLLCRYGISVVSANYRLSGEVRYPEYIQDAARAAAWTLAHAVELGWDRSEIYLGGISAGAYLAAMLIMNPDYLAEAGAGALEPAGGLIISAQVATHFQVRGERGIPTQRIVVDEAAPLYYCRPVTPPMLLVVGDSDMPARLEENAYFHAVLRSCGNRRVHFQVIPDRDHHHLGARIGEPDDPCGEAIARFLGGWE